MQEWLEKEGTKHVHLCPWGINAAFEAISENTLNPAIVVNACTNIKCHSKWVGSHTQHTHAKAAYVSEWWIFYITVFASIRLPPLSCLPATPCPVLFPFPHRWGMGSHSVPPAQGTRSCLQLQLQMHPLSSTDQTEQMKPINNDLLVPGPFKHWKVCFRLSHTSAKGYILLWQMRPEALFVSVHKVSRSTQHCKAHSSPAMAYLEVLPVSLLQKHSVSRKHKLTYR